MKNRKHFKLLLAVLTVLVLCVGCAAKAETLECGHTSDSEIADHSACELCGGYVCVDSHGEGICVQPEAAEEKQPEVQVTPEPTPVPTPEAIPEPEATPVPKSSDRTLHEFTATFPDGYVVEMNDPDKRKNITVEDMYSVIVNAIPSDSNAVLSGDLGKLPLNPGINDFWVFVTAEDGTQSTFHYCINVVMPKVKDRTETYPPETWRPEE